MGGGGASTMLPGGGGHCIAPPSCAGAGQWWILEVISNIPSWCHNLACSLLQISNNYQLQNSTCVRLNLLKKQKRNFKKNQLMKNFVNFNLKESFLFLLQRKTFSNLIRHTPRAFLSRRPSDTWTFSWVTPVDRGRCVDVIDVGGRRCDL